VVSVYMIHMAHYVGYIVKVVGSFEKGNSPTDSLRGLEFVG